MNDVIGFYSGTASAGSTNAATVASASASA